MIKYITDHKEYETNIVNLIASSRYPLKNRPFYFINHIRLSNNKIFSKRGNQIPPLKYNTYVFINRNSATFIVQKSR